MVYGRPGNTNSLGPVISAVMISLVLRDNWAQERIDFWQSLTFPFGSEMPWDNTGHEVSPGRAADELRLLD